MQLREIMERLGLELVTKDVDIQGREVVWAYTSDLLSDVMANAQTGDLWCTIQRHLNIVAVAKLKELGGIVLANGIIPSEDVVAKAAQEDVPIFVSRFSLFELSGRLYELLRGESDS